MTVSDYRQPVVFGVARQDKAEHVLALDDVQSEYHNGYKQQASSHRRKQYHVCCIQTGFLAIGNHSCCTGSVL